MTKKKPVIVKNVAAPQIRSVQWMQACARALPCPKRVGAWLAIIAFVALTAAAFTGRDRMASPEASHETTSNPTELSPQDRGIYALAFSAQAKGDFSEADDLTDDLSNRNLMSYVLAERYLSGSYSARKEELSQWLTNYADHPQAARIANIAAARGVHVALPKLDQPLRGEGYGDHIGRSAMPDAWYSAIGDWRAGDVSDAAEIFTKLSENENLSDWQRSAAYYWAYRAADKLGKSDDARVNLKHAAEYRTTFYGLLATKQLGMRIVTADAPEVSDTVRDDPRAIRAVLLVQMDRSDDAETELRALYAATSKNHRGGIVTLASELDLPNLQMRLARTPGLSDSESLFGQYPMPHYMVDLHPVMDSALLMAVARNESGFRAVAQSSAGAVGMMQILPSTAQMIEHRVGEQLLRTADASGDMVSLAARLNDPALSARYGAEYLKILAREPAIQSNLIHLLVGYNAGPGTVISWKAAAGNMSDPLLYIESIPYAETRNYVMQVSAQYWIYQRMMDETPTSLAALARGEWPVVGAGI